MAKQSAPDAAADDPWRNWHRYFGLILTSHLEGSPFTVELEKDLSKKQQLLDMAIVRRGPGEVTCLLPDGLDDFTDHNLVTFKSHREPLDDWTLKEQTGHYVNYRKQVSPRGQLLPEDQFRLYAVCARRPRDLFAAVPPEEMQPGVYTLCRGTDAIRIVVAAEPPKTERNALLHLFSAAPDQVEYGAKHYELRTPEISSIINDLFKEYRLEGLTMPYTMEDYRKKVAEEVFEEMTLEERLRILEKFKPEERLGGLSTEQIKAYLRPLRKESPARRKKTRSKK